MSQYVHLALTLAVALGILAVIIGIFGPAFERWRFSRYANRMLELKSKHKRD